MNSHFVYLQNIYKRFTKYFVYLLNVQQTFYAFSECSLNVYSIFITHFVNSLNIHGIHCNYIGRAEFAVNTLDLEKENVLITFCVAHNCTFVRM